MKRVLFFLALVPTMAFAAERSANAAAEIAAQFMNQQVLAPARKAATNASSYKLTHTRQKLNSVEPAFYVFNNTSEGYVVVSADDRTEDVLMYSEEGTLDVEKANPNLKFWLNRLQEEISVANDENTYTAEEKKARKAVQVEAISPLLVNDKGEDIAWYQESPYWNQCPMDLWKTSERCLTGCVATAAAMIMYKWRYPEQGTGSHSYTWKCCTNSECTTTTSQKISKDFSTVTFDWDNMLANYKSGKSGNTAQQNAVAELMYCCGVACDMGYGGETIGGSGAYTDVMGQGMVDYFGYKAEKFITTYSKYNYGTAAFSPAEYSVETSKFEEYFNADLEAGRPIIMGGEDEESGHEFVCDGRNSSGYFHINWGWEGSGNNYCLLSSLKPSSASYKFSSNIDALIGLEPKDRKMDTVHVTGVSVTPTTLELKIKEKSSITATIAPTNATVKTITWSSSDDGIVSVSTSGQVVGVSAGKATITATTKDGGYKATCAITVDNDTIESSDCEKYTYTFTSKCKTGTNELGDYTWTISLTKGEIQNVDGTKGQQFGSSKTACKQVSLTTKNTADCLIKTVKVSASKGSGGDGKLAVYIAGKQVGDLQSLTTSNKEYTFTNTSDEKGNLEIRLTNGAKAMYIKTIEVNPDGGGEPEDTKIEGLAYATAIYYPTTATYNAYWAFDLYKEYSCAEGLTYPELFLINYEDATSGTEINGSYTPYYAGYWKSANDSVETDEYSPVGEYTVSCTEDGYYSFVGSFEGTNGKTYTFNAKLEVYAYNYSTKKEITLSDCPGSDLEEVEELNQTQSVSYKKIVGDQFYIIYKDHVYNAQGSIVK